MAFNNSVFPEGGYDTFPKLSDLPPSMIGKAQEYKFLQVNDNKTPVQVQRYNTLKTELQEYLISPSLFNHFSDSITGIQKFFVENTSDFIDDLKQDVKDYTDTKQAEIGATVASFNTHVANEKVIITTYVDNKKIEMTQYADDKLHQVQLTMSESITTMQNKKDHFIQLVNTKQDEIQQMVQDFDSRTARFYQEWTATNGQTEFNIYNGLILDIPQEAMLVLSEKDILVVVQGTVLRPKVDYEIKSNSLYDTIKLKGNAQSMVSAGTEVSAGWYKNVGKLYFTHASTHELGGSDEIKNIQEPQLNPDLKAKINSGNLTISTMKPTSGMWYKVVG